MAVNKLLVAFDESEGADRALAMAASLAAVNPEAHVDVVYVVPIPLLDETQMANFKDILDMMISDGEDLLARGIARCSAKRWLCAQGSTSVRMFHVKHSGPSLFLVV